MGAGYYDGLRLSVPGWLSASLPCSQVITVDTTGAQLVSVNFIAIDESDFFGAKIAQATTPFCAAISTVPSPPSTI